MCVSLLSLSWGSEELTNSQLEKCIQRSRRDGKVAESAQRLPPACSLSSSVLGLSPKMCLQTSKPDLEFEALPADSWITKYGLAEKGNFSVKIFAQEKRCNG